VAGILPSTVPGNHIGENGVCRMDPKGIYRRLASSFRAVFQLRTVAAEEQDRQWLQGEIRSVCAQLEQADRVFNNVTEPELIDAAIFTMRACERRLGYLFKQAKALHLTDICHNKSENKLQDWC
jgi:hypothetical protein